MTDPDVAKFRDAMDAAIDKYVKQQVRNTIALNAERDPACAGYARIPGPDACDFCVTMGAANDFYHTEKTAGGGELHGTADDHYHPHCNCQVCLVFDKGGKHVARDPQTGEAVPYDPADMLRRYEEAGRPTFSGGSGRSRLSWQDVARLQARLESAESLDDLRAIGAEIERAVPKHARQGGKWRTLQAAARKSDRELKGNLYASARGNGRTPAVPLSKAEAIEKAKTCDRPVFCYVDDHLHDDGVRIRLGEEKYHVVAHGTPDSLIVFENEITHEELAEILEARGDYNGGPIALVSCSAGDARAPGYCFAQKLANSTGETVTAATDVLWTDGTKDYIIGDKPFNPFHRGSFKDFSPEVQ